MTQERKKYLDGLWMNTEVGRWARCKARGDDSGADRIRETLFSQGYLSPMDYLINQEGKVFERIKQELKSVDEGKSYLLEIEKSDPNLLDVMVAYECSLLDLYYV